MRLPPMRLVPRIIVLLMVALAPTFVDARNADAITYPLIDLGGFGAVPVAINAAGQIAGYEGTAGGNGSIHAFLYSGGMLTDIGTAGFDESIGYNMNAAGEVVGRLRMENDVYARRGFLYSGGAMINLGTFPTVTPFSQSEAYAINDAGEVVGGSTIGPAAEESHVFIYSAGVMTDLGTLGGGYGFPYAINASSQIVGGSTTPSSPTSGGDYHAFLYSGGVMTDLGTLGTWSEAHYINNAGQIVGQSDTASGDTHAFLYSGSVMIDLGTLGGGYSEAYGINASGQIVGYSATSSGDYHAFLYSGGIMIDLGTFGGTESIAYAINDAGQVAGEATVADAYESEHAFLYSGGVMIDLGTLGGSNSYATAINDAGQVAGASEVTGNMVVHLFMTSPCGNGAVDPGEQCDDGNVIAGDGCDGCRLEPPMPTPTLTATATVTVTPTPTPTPVCTPPPPDCGNGVREAGEECDFGGGEGGHNGDSLVDKCTTDCKCIHPTHTDVDCDGVDDGCDNCVGLTCPLVGHDPWYNPDQRNTDCAPGGTVAGCREGDVCDPCPARSNDDDCDHALSGGTNAGPTTPTVLSLPVGGPDLCTHPPNATIMITVPPFALCGDTSISVTNLLGPADAFAIGTLRNAKYALRPEGLHFVDPANIALTWDDANNDDQVNEGLCVTHPVGTSCSASTTCAMGSDCPSGDTCPDGSSTPETKLVLKRNNKEFSKDGFGCSGTACECLEHDPLGNSLNCSGPGGLGAHAKCTDAPGHGCATVALGCSRAGNNWAFETCDFSSLLLGQAAADLIPGGGKPATDCFQEWAVENPFNEPAREKPGLPNRKQTCTDGDPACDADGSVNGACTFRVGICFNNEDPRLQTAGTPVCTPAEVATWELQKPRPTSTDPIEAANALALRGAIGALGTSTIGGVRQQLVTFTPALTSGALCSPLVDVTVPRKGHGKGHATVGARAGTTPPPGKTHGTRDTDKVKLICLPPP